MPEERRFLRDFKHKVRRRIASSSNQTRSTHGSDQHHDHWEQLPSTCSGPAHWIPPRESPPSRSSLLDPPQPSSAAPNRQPLQDTQLSATQQPREEQDKPELFAEVNRLPPQQTSRRPSASPSSLKSPVTEPDAPDARGRQARKPNTAVNTSSERNIQTPSDAPSGQLSDEPPSPRSYSYFAEDFFNKAAESSKTSSERWAFPPRSPLQEEIQTEALNVAAPPFSTLKTVPEDPQSSGTGDSSSAQSTGPQTNSAAHQGSSARTAPLAKQQSQREASNTSPSGSLCRGRPPAPSRRQSLLSDKDQGLANALLSTPDNPSQPPPPLERAMVHRNVWVKRPSGSPTQVNVSEDDLVDDLREFILKRYANSLGRNLDPPDLQIRIYPRDNSPRRGQDRILNEQEFVGDTLRDYYPGGQTAAEALVIEIPRRTPRPSPRHMVSYGPPVSDDHYVPEQSEYFPPMSMIHQGTHAHGHPPYEGSHSAHHSTSSLSGSHQVHSMSVINTGQVPNIPSPGSRGSWHHQQHQQRPRYSRQHTSSPTTHPTSPSPNRSDTAAVPMNGAASLPSPPAVSTPPIPVPEQAARPAQTPPIRVSSPRPSQQKSRKPKKTVSNGNTNNNNNNSTHKLEASSIPNLTLSPTANVRDETIPPVNVLIVEDNIINLKLLEAFMMRISVPYQVAMNGRDAVNKWRTGGFHIVLMDIQLPILNGLEATKEIRRLERVNNIGVFSKTVSSSASSPIGRGNSPFETGTLNPEDVLDKGSKFKSPVIIVALTASSLQSDRHEALAAGCNDFLTKPVNMIWLGQKVREWGCMQALIDFEGWRKWRGYADSHSQTPSPAPTAQRIASPPTTQPIANVLKG